MASKITPYMSLQKNGIRQSEPGKLRNYSHASFQGMDLQFITAHSLREKKDIIHALLELM